MGKGFSKLGLFAAAAGGLLFLYARQRAAETGRDIPSVIANLPEELAESWAEWQSRARVAIDAGMVAAREREENIEESLAGGGGSENSVAGYPV